MKYKVGDLNPSGIIDFNEIKETLQRNQLDNRSFQGDYKALIEECQCVTNTEEFLRRYHVQRIAWFVSNNNWFIDPIVLYSNGAVLDGGHRIWAAKYTGADEIEGIKVLADQFTDEFKSQLWIKVSEFNGNMEEALKALSIPYVV